MDKLPVKDLKKALDENKYRVYLFDPRDEYFDKAFLEQSFGLEPTQVIIDFQEYDLNVRESLRTLYVDLKYYTSSVATELKSNELKQYIDNEYRQGLEWAKSGSHVPISNLLNSYMREFKKTFNKPPWILLKNIDVETEVSHAAIGSLVFDAIESPDSERVIITCHHDNWIRFEKGNDIFARTASRLRSFVAKLIRGTTP
jgi:hypothetical protein